MLRNGKGVAQSHVEAVKWYYLAAEGYASALNNLGVSRTVQGVPRDDHEALRFFRQAAAKGLAGVAASGDIVAAILASARA